MLHNQANFYLLANIYCNNGNTNNQHPSSHHATLIDYAGALYLEE